MVWIEKSRGYSKNKTESQRQEAKIQNLRTPENSLLQGTLIDKRSSKSLHTYTETKLHPRVKKFQSKTYQANSQQRRNITLSIKIQAAKSHTEPIDTSQHTTGHLIALQREQIQLHPPEHQASFPNQETLISHLSNPTHREEPPQKRGATNFQHTERPPKHRNLNRMKRQRNI